MDRCRKRGTFLTGTRPITNNENLFAGGVIGHLSTEKSGFGFRDNGGNKGFCSGVYPFVNSETSFSPPPLSPTTAVLGVT